jgi:hypothetical protein
VCSPSEHSAKNKTSIGSVFNNIETSVDFNSERFGLKDQKDSFLKVNYRIKNIELTKALNKTKYSENETIKKITKGLMCCASMSGIEVGARGAAIYKTSAKCRRTVCPSCNQARATKFRNRFISCFNSPSSTQFQGKYFYFITLTLKHNLKDTRTNVYLDELKNYVKRMKEWKLWKKHFPYSKKNPKSGFAQSFELTMGKNGYHIHSHMMMCAPPLKGAVSTIEKQFKKLWKATTGDSYGFRLDLVHIDAEETEKIREGKFSKKMQKLVSEVLKYTVKVGDFHNISEFKSDLLATWLIQTKGKNMIVSGGFFRDLQLFTLKSKWDKKKEKEIIDYRPNKKYLVGRTCDLSFNYRKNKHFTKARKYNMLSTVYLKNAPNFQDITHCAAEFEKYFSMSIRHDQFKENTKLYDAIPRLIEAARVEKEENIYLSQFIDKQTEKKKEAFIKEFGFDVDELAEQSTDYNQESEELNQDFINKISFGIKAPLPEDIKPTAGQQTVLELYPFDDW